MRHLGLAEPPPSLESEVITNMKNQAFYQGKEQEYLRESSLTWTRMIRLSFNLNLSRAHFTADWLFLSLSMATAVEIPSNEFASCIDMLSGNKIGLWYES